MRILIADDDPISRRLLQSYLERWGHEVVVTHDGLEAWRAFQAELFPIVITDWVMPEIDGVELIRRVRACEPASYVYTILLTAKAQKEDIVVGMESGADDFVTKPFDRDELRVRLRAGERIIRLEAMLAERLQSSRSDEGEARDTAGGDASAWSPFAGEIDATIAEVAADLTALQAQLPPGPRHDPRLEHALERLGSLRARLAALRVQP